MPRRRLTTLRKRITSLQPEIITKHRRWPRHIWVPDTQVKPGVPTKHIRAAANYIAAKQPDVVIVAGDWWDNPSLSTYEPPHSDYWDSPDRTIAKDIDAGNKAMEMFLAPILRLKRRPRLVFTMGNHEHRMDREVRNSPRMRGLIERSDLVLGEFETFDYMVPVAIDGILYCHVFCNPQSLKKNVLGGTIDNRLNKLKHSFTMGHQQTLLYGLQDLLDGRRIQGLVAGAFHAHDEQYAGPQGSGFWRGIVVKNEVHDGMYDPCFVSMQYLLDKWL